MRVLVWACFLLQIFVFIFSVIIVDTLRFRMLEEKKNISDDPELMEYWGDIHTACLSLLQIATFADWTIPVASLVQYRSLYFLIIFYMGFVGVGIMNLILALMVQFAYSIANQDTASVTRRDSIRALAMVVQLQNELPRVRSKVLSESWMGHGTMRDFTTKTMFF